MHTLVIRFLTFPGVVFHAAIRQIFCHWAGLVVMSVGYFKMGIVPIHIEHEEPMDWWQALFISWGPFFLSSFVALMGGLSAMEAIRYDGLPWFNGIIVWFAFSIAANAFPLPQDADLLLRRSNPKFLLWVISVPLAVVTKVVFFSSFIFVDLVYASIVVIFLPLWLVQYLALAY